MKIADFERAVAALCCDIVIDDMALSGGIGVRVCYGHTDGALLLWDMFGRAFRFDTAGRFAEVDSDTHQNVPFELYSRAPEFDLKF